MSAANKLNREDTVGIALSGIGTSGFGNKATKNINQGLEKY